MCGDIFQLNNSGAHEGEGAKTCQPQIPQKLALSRPFRGQGPELKKPILRIRLFGIAKFWAGGKGVCALVFVCYRARNYKSKK